MGSLTHGTRSAQSADQPGEGHTRVRGTGEVRCFVDRPWWFLSMWFEICHLRSHLFHPPSFLLFIPITGLAPGLHASFVCYYGNAIWSRSRWRTLRWSQPKKPKTCCTHWCQRTWCSFRYIYLTKPSREGLPASRSLETLFNESVNGFLDYTTVQKCEVA